MAAYIETIKHLNLSGSDQDSIQNAARLIEDACNTVTIPGLDSDAVVLVKRLGIGVIDPHTSAVVLAGRIATLLAHSVTNAVDVTDTDYQDAVIAYLPNRLCGFMRVLEKVVMGDSMAQWYWPGMLSELGLSGSPTALTASDILACLLFEDSDVIAQSIVIEGLMARGIATRLVADVPEQTAQEFLQKLRISTYNESAELTDKRAAAIDLPISARWAELISSNIPTATDTERFSATRITAKTLWLALLAAVSARPSALLLPGIENVLTRIVQRLARNRVDEENDPQDSGSAALTTDRDRMPGRGLERTGSVQDRHHAARNKQHLTERSTSQLTTLPVTAMSEMDATIGQTEGEVLRSGVHTSAIGGLTLLIPMLGRLEIERLLIEAPHLIELDFPGQLFGFIAERFGLLDDDPLRVLTAAESSLDGSLVEFKAPASWWQLADEKETSHTTLGRGNILLRQTIDDGPVSVAVLARTTYLLMSKYLRRYAGMSMRDLVFRRATIVVTPTHLDVNFGSTGADIRLRRIGLDTDPGWVTWLGKVVRYHYQRDEQRNG